MSATPWQSPQVVGGEPGAGSGPGSVGLGQDRDVAALIGGEPLVHAVLGVEQHDHRMEPARLLRRELGVGDDDDVIARLNQAGGGAVDADGSGVAGSFDGVGLEPVAVVDVHHLHPLERHDPRRREQSGVDGDAAFVMQVGLGHRGAVQLRLAEGEEHGEEDSDTRLAPEPGVRVSSLRPPLPSSGRRDVFGAVPHRLADRQEGRDGRDGRGAAAVCPPPHDRQSAFLPGRGRAQRLRGVPAHRRRPGGIPGRGPLDRADRHPRRSGRASLGRVGRHPRELGGPPRGLPRPHIDRDHLRRPDHALGRRAHSALRDLPSARLHLRPREPRVRRGRRVPQRDREFLPLARRGRLPRRDVRALLSYVSRHRIGPADPGRQSSPLQRAAPRRRAHLCDRGRGRVRVGTRRHPRRVGPMTVDLRANVPDGPIEKKWDTHRFDMKLVNPANKRKHRVIMVGTGLAGGSAAASLAELGYDVHCFCFQDSPRRAHSIAAQGGINAAKNYQNDGDSIWRLFYDTVKGGDFRSREANVYRLAQISVNIIDQCAAQGVPFAREYGGLLANRSFGGAQVSRTFYARGQTGQQLLLGAYQAMAKQIGLGTVTMYPRTEMLDVVVIDGQARGIVVRDLVTGAVSSHAADAVVLATGGYSNVFFLSTNAKGCNVTATWRAHKRGALFANPCFTQIHPTCIPAHGEHQSKLTLMSELLRNDGRIWVPKKAGDRRRAAEIPDAERDYYLERMYPSFGNLVPRDVASRRAKEMCDSGFGVGEGGHGVFLDFREAIGRLGQQVVAERYGNLFEMYQRITGENPFDMPMRIYPAPHYTMGGLWVDYNLMSTVPGLHVIGEANFSDHGANRLGASALMQGLADGYFVLPYTLGHYFASTPRKPVTVDHPEFKKAEADVKERIKKLLSVKGKRTVTSFHRELGLL